MKYQKDLPVVKKHIFNGKKNMIKNIHIYPWRDKIKKKKEEANISFNIYLWDVVKSGLL